MVGIVVRLSYSKPEKPLMKAELMSIESSTPTSAHSKGFRPASRKRASIPNLATEWTEWSAL